MKIKKLIYMMCLLCGGTFSITSCDYLDVSEELAENLTLDETFDNPAYVRRWYGGLYNVITNYTTAWSGGQDGFSGFWCGMSGETLVSSGGVVSQMRDGFTASTAPAQRWTTLYRYIRDSWLFIEKAHVVGDENDIDYINSTELSKMVAEVKFLIAYSYMSLFELYGPVPYIDKTIDANDKTLDFARTPINEFLTKVDGLLEEIINSGYLTESVIQNSHSSQEGERYNLSEVVRPTKIAAMALRAKLWVYAASPLFNGGYKESLQLSNNDGTTIFTAKDDSRWEKAKDYLEALIKEAENKGHKLYVYTNSETGQADPHESVYRLYQYFNDEILWASGQSGYNSGNAEKNTDPRSLFNGWANCGITQNSVDAFFDKDGLCIDDPGSVYSEKGFSDVMNPVNKDKRVDKNVYNMYANREPRFYANVIYQGKSWHIQPNARPNFFCNWAKGGDADNTNANCPRAGDLLGKFKNRTIRWEGGGTTLWGRPLILFRLADFYLYYAEVLNEINPQDPLIITYLDKVRERAGIPGYKKLATDNKKNIIGDQQKQRKAIQHERQIEMMAEGVRYFDVRRWMIAGQGEDGDQSVIWGMNLNGKSSVTPGESDSYYTRTKIENRAWQRAMYLYPIPLTEINNSKGGLLKQNPLW